MKVYCEGCKTETFHEEVITPYTLKGYPPIFDTSWEESYYIARCKGCHTITFIKKYGDEDMWETNDFGEREHYVKYTIYQEETVDRQKLHSIQTFKKIPSLISGLYIEIVNAYNRNLLLLCCVGLRMVIEAICKDKGIPDKSYSFNADDTPKVDSVTGEQKFRFINLNEKMAQLKQDGHITQVQLNVLLQIKDLGNESAHDITKHNEIIIREAIRVIETMLYNIYDLASIDFSKLSERL